MRIAILGFAGAMGGFFVKYFLAHGHAVVGHDLSRVRTVDRRVVVSDTNERAVRGADVVLIATPVDTTFETIRKVSKAIEQGQWVVEMTSVKAGLLAPVKEEVQRRGARLLSIHPLFGPLLSEVGLETKDAMKICLVDGDAETRGLAERLFPDAKIIPMSLKEHEKSMGLILSLTHLLNLAYAATVNRYFTADEFRRVETPTSGTQLSLAEGILSQSPKLYSFIQMENEYSKEYATALLEEVEKLRGMIATKDRKGFERAFSSLAREYSSDSKHALAGVYQSFEKRIR